MLRDRLERAFARPGPRLQRLAAAGTTVCFLVRGVPDAAVTLFLDRQPPCVISTAEPAEVTIELSPTQAGALARGTLSLPPALWAGEISFSGQVRRYLAVDPVLRAMLLEVDESV